MSFQPERKLKNKVRIGSNIKQLPKGIKCYILFNSGGVVLQFTVPQGKNVTGHMYANIIMPAKNPKVLAEEKTKDLYEGYQTGTQKSSNEGIP